MFTKTKLSAISMCIWQPVHDALMAGIPLMLSRFQQILGFDYSLTKLWSWYARLGLQFNLNWRYVYMAVGVEYMNKWLDYFEKAPKIVDHVFAAPILEIGFQF